MRFRVAATTFSSWLSALAPRDMTPVHSGRVNTSGSSQLSKSPMKYYELLIISSSDHQRWPAWTCGSPFDHCDTPTNGVTGTRPAPGVNMKRDQSAWTSCAPEFSDACVYHNDWKHNLPYGKMKDLGLLFRRDRSKR